MSDFSQINLLDRLNFAFTVHKFELKLKSNDQNIIRIDKFYVKILFPDDDSNLARVDISIDTTALTWIFDEVQKQNKLLKSFI